MAKVKCDLNNLVLIENGHLTIQKVVDSNEFNCTNVNTTPCTNLARSNGRTSPNSCKALCQTDHCQLNQATKNSIKSQDTQPSGSSSFFVHHQTLNKNLFNKSTYFEIIKSNKYGKDQKADLKFPRKFVNVIKKELSEDGKLIGTKRLTKTCVLQPSLFENIPPTIYFGLEDELSRF